MEGGCAVAGEGETAWEGGCVVAGGETVWEGGCVVAGEGETVWEGGCAVVEGEGAEPGLGVVCSVTLIASFCPNMQCFS